MAEQILIKINELFDECDRCLKRLDELEEGDGDDEIKGKKILEEEIKLYEMYAELAQLQDEYRITKFNLIF